MKVTCTVSRVELENEEGHQVDGIIVTCERCGNSEESFGNGAASVRRCLALMRENCLNDESNFYEADGDEP